MRLVTSGVKLAAFTAALFLTACTTDKPEPVATAAPPPPVSTPMAQPTPAPAAPAPTVTVIPGSRQDFVENVGDRVFFAYDRADLEQPARDVLQRQAQWLARFPNVVLVLEGHADERGTREYNLALGARRAASMREFLVSLGVTGARLETISYGKERPVCAESTDQCWQQNRRGVSVIKSGEVAAAF